MMILSSALGLRDRFFEGTNDLTHDQLTWHEDSALHNFGPVDIAPDAFGNHSQLDDFQINLATGLPMVGGWGGDVAGNPWGTDLHDTTHTCWNDFCDDSMDSNGFASSGIGGDIGDPW